MVESIIDYIVNYELDTVLMLTVLLVVYGIYYIVV